MRTFPAFITGHLYLTQGQYLFSEITFVEFPTPDYFTYGLQICQREFFGHKLQRNG